MATEKEPTKRVMPKRVMLIPDGDALKVLGRDIGPRPNETTGESEWREPTAAINGALAEYAYLIDRAAGELAAVLNRAEWNALADVLNGCADLHDYGTTPMNPLVLIVAELHDGDRYNGIGAKWGIDVPDLCGRLAALTPLHGYAVHAAVRWLWTHSDAIDHTTAEWWAVGFRRPPAGKPPLTPPG